MSRRSLKSTYFSAMRLCVIELYQFKTSDISASVLKIEMLCHP